MKNFLFVLTLLFSLSSFSQSPVDKSFPPEELFALGSYYYPEQWDSSQWERDLKKMSEMGIKFTHFAEFAWSMMEPEEGEYHFYQYFLARNGCEILQELCQLLAVFNDGTAYLYYCYFFHL